MPKQSLRVGVAQMTCQLSDVEANLDIIAEFVAQARTEGVQLLVFPELATSGYDVGSQFSQAAIRADGAEAKRLQELSQDVDLAVGFIEETENVQFFNSAMYLSGGKIRYVHRKVYPPNYRIFEERRYFGAGEGVGAFNTAWSRMGMLICGDAWHLSLPYLIAHDGANVLNVMAASSTEGLSPSVSSADAWERMNRSYALTLSTFVIFANRVGSEAGLHFWGGSHIILPDGNLLAKAPLHEPDLLVADLDFEMLRHQRLILPFRRDDSLELTVDLGRRIREAKSYRRDGFLCAMEPMERAHQRSAPSPPPPGPIRASSKH